MIIIEYSTLRDIYGNFQISRRTIQGYEMYGLVHHSVKKKYGHLLYDREMVEKIRIIRFYQQAGFTVKEIVEIIGLESQKRKEILIKQLGTLMKRKKELEELIISVNKEIQKM